MKRILHYAMAALVAVGISSCVKEGDGARGGNMENVSRGKLTFVLPTIKNTITYAGDVPASDAEKTLANTAIFMFGTGGLEAVIGESDQTAGIANGNQTVTIDIDDTWTGDKTFFFVGNGDGKTSSLPTDADSPMTEAEFLALLTDIHDKTDNMKTPLLMSGKASVTDVETAAAANVTLHRSVARLDVINDVTTNKVTINKVIVKNANLQGYIMGYEDVTKIANGAKGDLPKVSVNAAVDGKQEHKSLLYIYPTVIGADESGTQIFLEGTVGGTTKTYSLKGDNDITIKANHRYIISAIDEHTLTFEIIEIADWDEGDEELIGNPINGTFELVGEPEGTAVEEVDNNVITVNQAGGVITFNVKATSSLGTTFTIAADEDLDDHTSHYDVNHTTSSTVTYSVPYFAASYTIDVDALPANESSITTITITDKAKPSEKCEVVIEHGIIPVEGDGIGEQEWGDGGVIIIPKN